MKYQNIDVDIRDVQIVELEILLEFDRICKKYDIPYQLFAGTLLGAIRHEGFIPWDDDIDVCLLRKDYERFLNVCESGEVNEKYFLQTNKTDPKSIIQFAKLRKNGTAFETKCTKGPDIHTGIYIDIFPMDNVKIGTFKGRFQTELFNFLNILESSSNINIVKNASTAGKRFGRALFHCIFKLIPKSRVDNLIQRVLHMFPNDKTEYVSHLTNGENTPKRFLQRREQFYETVPVKFEGHMFPGPKNYDEVLRRHYGDYMEYPPEKDRVPNHGVVKVVTNHLSMKRRESMRKSALVVGGGNGIGLSLVAELLRRDYSKIYIADKISPKEDDIPQDIRNRFLESTSFIQINLINQDYSCLPKAEEIDMLIITAGFGRVAPFNNLTEAEIKNLLIVNELSVMMIIKKYYDRIFSDDDMYCAVMGSISGHVVSPLFSVYGATKSGVCMFIESINTELAVNYKKNRILDVSPGMLDGTNFYGKGNSLDTLGTLPGEIIDKMFAREKIFIPAYDQVYKSVLEYYHRDPYGFGRNSYAHKISGKRSSDQPQTKIGYLSGTFDLFHIGHLNILKRAKDFCDYLVVGVHRSGAWKGKETFIPFEERTEIVQNIKYVDRVIESYPEDMDAWDVLGYHYLFVGSDYKGSERFKKYEEFFAHKDVEIIYFPYTSGTSSTQLRSVLRKVVDEDNNTLKGISG